MTILRQPHTQEQSKTHRIRGLPPLMLSNPSMVTEHTPCTLHLSVLPPDLACRLFYVMIGASKKWQRNKWWLFDRVVESPHKTSFFARPMKASGRNVDEWQEAARFWYNGRMTDPPEEFLPEMEQACEIVEKVVNEELKKRNRYPLEYAGTQGKDLRYNKPVWEANVAAANCYEGAKESVGFHSDQLTYLGPYPTIASLSLGTTRVFRLREVIPINQAESRQARTFNIPLTHNSLTIMHASCQERFKHSIPPQSTIDLFRPTVNPDIATSSKASPGSCVTYPPSNCRINITFRFYRPDFRPQSIPKCDCGVPTILRPDMKSRTDGETEKYWWTCYAGAQNDGKGCKFWRVMDMEREGRGPCVGDLNSPKTDGRSEGMKV
ncbi:hypothetical protein AGABI2DRAFT_199713 [Agaricus bisporus var. bisporus H97]|uniref:hypothetical protein n=1 Tax=Agaricus bisporus var. bisporus (strain H97 / ATCC MYA-4626 / FGSC 10389) TaxID=936046 RepID=UPI00029F627A|nr:hypothetical protein AGABI2DRAFT_199713 [Agaricus bisporus var. bisporus H97]EKV50203.1 hypothetical protein AGABI2DRAFT_199713 [Agaricus bisporus var. bisporus H97]